MYAWRKMTDLERQETLQDRRASGHPWHSVPFIDSGIGPYLLTAACYEHEPHIARSTSRIDHFSEALQSTLTESTAIEKLVAWAVLPNHYHALCEVADIASLKIDLGKLHGRTSFEWNREDDARGRKVWFRAAETAIKSDRHYWATINYIHHNPVKHRCAADENQWRWSSIHTWREGLTTEAYTDLKQSYPIDDYGKTWDNEDLSSSKLE